MLKFLEEYRVYLVYFPLFLYWIILLIATSLPAPDLPDVWGSDKSKHYLAYLILSVLLNLAILFQKKVKMNTTKAAYITLLICIVYGALDEIHQMFIPGRSAETLDLLADALGSATGILLVLYLVKKNSYNRT